MRARGQPSGCGCTSVSVLWSLCVRISVTIAVHAGCVWNCVCVCVELCVCVFLDAQLCRNLCNVWVAGALVSLQARLLASSSLLSPPTPPPCCHQRLCFHPPSTASETLDFASVAPTEAPSPLLSLRLSSSWLPPVAVRGVHMGCAGPRGAPPFCCRDCLGSAPSQL